MRKTVITLLTVISVCGHASIQNKQLAITGKTPGANAQGTRPLPAAARPEQPVIIDTQPAPRKTS